MRHARNSAQHPGQELDRLQHALVFGYRLVRQGALQLKRDAAPLMAGALAFRTLFGLFPVIIVGTILARAFMGREAFESILSGLFARMFGEQLGAGEGSLGAFMMEMVTRAQEINLTAMGWVGSAVLVYSALGLLVTIENTFNRICRAPSGRSWLRRVPVYWAALTLGPLALGMLLFVNTRFVALTSGLDDWHGVISAVRALWSFAIVWLLLLGIYRLMPAVSVALRPALVGSFVTTLLLSVGQGGLGAYLQGMQSIKLWGSVGLIPLFMFWVYLMWLAVLLGLQVTTILQRMHSGAQTQEADGSLSDGQLADALEGLAGRLRDGEVGDREQRGTDRGSQPGLG